jgi:hypothetical protein
VRCAETFVDVSDVLVPPSPGRWWWKQEAPLKRRLTSRCYIPEDSHFHTRRRKNLKSDLNKIWICYYIGINIRKWNYKFCINSKCPPYRPPPPPPRKSNYCVVIMSYYVAGLQLFRDLMDWGKLSVVSLYKFTGFSGTLYYNIARWVWKCDFQQTHRHLYTLLRCDKWGKPSDTSVVLRCSAPLEVAKLIL